MSKRQEQNYRAQLGKGVKGFAKKLHKKKFWGAILQFHSSRRLQSAQAKVMRLQVFSPSFLP
ncbi:MAG: hypothetical protein AYP45_12680 [Candidatus Brocadia carolinensis]|uniref:Uncharacterized protein n=1 Tax=Candidatus Brocadia carolinensis TaxID=1004156 RepID=A0A1V4ARN6_9BACT|nr:MAG: hypothetical protein AYP45_12680 [Candidatus Brocadia caroliniensis]